MNMFIIVGGTGFLGRRVAARLRADGAEVRELSRRTGFDGTRPDPALLRGAEAVVNLAGIKREEGAQTFRGVHVDLVERLAGAMREAGVKRLVHVSVTAAKEGPARPYAHTKWLGEQAVKASGLDWTILRPGVIYGEGDDLLAHLSRMIRAAPVFPIVGTGRAPMRPVDVHDVAQAVAGALANPASAGQTYEVVGPERLELRDVVGRTSEALGLKTLILPTPSLLMRPFVFLMEKLWTRPLSTRAQLDMLKEGLDGDPGPAGRELGVRPAPFEPRRYLAKAERRFAASAVAFLACAAAAFSLRSADPWLALSLTLPALAAAALAVQAPSWTRPIASLVAGGALGLLHYGITRAALPLLDRIWPAWPGPAAELFAWQSGRPLAFLIPTLLLIVFAEEILWRGTLQRLLMEKAGFAAGLAGAAFLNGAVHAASGNPLLAAAAFGCSLWWGFLYGATGSLLVPAAAHLLWDLLVMFGPRLH